MHELSIAMEIVEAAAESARQAGATRVHAIHCRVGVLRQVQTDLLVEAFRVVSEGTTCADADLVVETVPATAFCRRCGSTYEIRPPAFPCPRCGVIGEGLTGGDELEITAIQAEVPDVPDTDRSSCAGPQRIGRN